MTPPLEAPLWADTLDLDRDWSEIIAYLVTRLSSYLGHEVRLGDLSHQEPEAFGCAIEGRIAIGGAFAIEWTGRLALQRLDGISHVSATLLLFSRKRRLQVAGHSGSMLELQFEPRPHGAGEWISHGWHEDLYGEWDVAAPPSAGAASEALLPGAPRMARSSSPLLVS